MKTRTILILPGIVICLFLSCSAPENLTSDKKTAVSFHLGSNLGGITENTDMSVVPGVSTPAEATVDAFSGATKPGLNTGVHVTHRFKRNQAETGLDYMYNHQTFSYTDAGNHYIGVRELHVSQLMIPVTYNFSLFRKTIPKADIQLKIGLIGQANFIAGKGTGILPEYSSIPLSGGPVLGLSFLPCTFRNGDHLGLYFDIYRGSQIYKDFYNQTDFEMPGSSFLKFGLKYQLR